MEEEKKSEIFGRTVRIFDLKASPRSKGVSINRL